MYVIIVISIPSYCPLKNEYFMNTQLPRLHCPYETSVNPLVSAAERHTAQWVLDFQLIEKDFFLERYQAQKFTSMVARMFPHCSFFALCLASDFNTFLFLLDDVLDSMSPGNDSEGFVPMVQDIVSILKQNKEFTLEDGNPILAAMSDIWNRMRKLGSNEWQYRFSSSLEAAFVANLWRIEHVNKIQSITVEEYMHYRPQIGGANFFVDLAEIMEGATLPTYLRSSSFVNSLGELCSRTICWANDIFSFPKEYEQGDELNLVMLLKRCEHLTLPAAIKRAVSIHDKEVRLFDNIGKQLISNSGSSRTLNRYVNVLSIMMRGNIDWSNESSRYKQPAYAD